MGYRSSANRELARLAGATAALPYNPGMVEITSEREQQFRQMRDVAREIFSAALKNASIESAFSRHVSCERGVLRICEDLYDLDSCSRVFVVSIGKAAHTMVAALEGQGGSRVEG